MEQGQGYIGEEEWRNKIHDRMRSLKLSFAAQFKVWSPKLLDWVDEISDCNLTANAIKQRALKLQKLLRMLTDFESHVVFLNVPKDRLMPYHGDALDWLEQSVPSIGAWLDEHVFRPSHCDTDTCLDLSTSLAKLDFNDALDVFEESMASLCTSLATLNCVDG